MEEDVPISEEAVQTEEAKKMEDNEASIGKDKYSIKQFAKSLMEIFEEPTPEQKEKRDFFKSVDIFSLADYFPRYKSNQAQYAITKFLDEKCTIKKIANYNDGMEIAPDYELLYINRKKRIKVLEYADVFCIYKNTKFVVKIYFSSQTRMIKLYFVKDNISIAEGFLKDFRSFMFKFNLYKNEKINFNHGFLSFLKYKKKSWEDIIISDEIKKDISNNLLFLLENKKKCKKLSIPWRRGILLEGKPGTGKTLLGNILCNILKCTVIWVSSKSIQDSSDIALLFDAARYLSPSLIFFEDIDLFGTDRDIERSRILGELLTQLDGAEENEGVFIIATTNKPHLLDRALVNRPSRFDIRIRIEKPNEKEREQLVRIFSNKKLYLNNCNDKIPEMTEDLTGAQIQEVIVHSTIKSLSDNRDYIRFKDLNESLKKLKMTINLEYIK